jgi:hypothetical protein
MMSTAGRAVRNAIDLLSNLTEEEALQIGREFYQSMGWRDTTDILSEIDVRIDLIRKGSEETLPK